MDAKCKLCGYIFKKSYKAQIFCSLNCSNRFNLNNKNLVILPQRYNEDLAEFFGVILGDGSVTKYFVKIYLNRIADTKYVPFIGKLSKKLFKNVPITYQERPKRGTMEIQISSKDICDYLKKIGFDAKKRKVPKWITKNKQFTKATVRGLFDTEGSVGIKYFDGKKGNYVYKQLTVTNKNENILQFLEKSLEKFGYAPTKNSKKNIYLSNKNDILKYLSDIGSSNPKIVKKIKIKKIDGFVWKVALNKKGRVPKWSQRDGLENR